MAVNKPAILFGAAVLAILLSSLWSYNGYVSRTSELRSLAQRRVKLRLAAGVWRIHADEYGVYYEEQVTAKEFNELIIAMEQTRDVRHQYSGVPMDEIVGLPYDFLDLYDVDGKNVAGFRLCPSALATTATVQSVYGLPFATKYLEAKGRCQAWVASGGPQREYFNGSGVPIQVTPGAKDSNK